ncbi:MAG TPA: ABC transporter permease [Vicinamibacterales bacterium]|nr:ABC transporter permease [Vicinamibacterales bacterium]
MTSFLQDLRYGVRVLVKSPGFSLVAILALAIGIGANTAIFSVVNTLLLQRLPYRDADRLAIVWEHNVVRDRKSNVVGPSNFVHWREMNRTFEDLTAVSPTYNVTLTGMGDPEEIPAQLVSVEFFSVLGVQPRLGRAFTPDENRPNVLLAVLSDRLWRRRFGADPAILNRPIQLQGQPVTVIGVAPPGFSLLDKTVDLWLPLPFTAQARTPGGRSLQVVGRLKPGVTFDAAQQDMTRVGADLTAMFPAFNTGWTVRVVPIREELTGKVRPALLVLVGAVAFVLLIACANVANLLLARATARSRELAVRAALGAGRARLVRQLLAESLLLSIAGGGCGLALGWWSVAFLRNVAAERLPIQRLEMVAIDGRVLAFTAAAAILSGILFGIVPAMTGAGANLNESLREGGRTGSGARGNRARAAFVVIEVALALVLLVGAGLLVRSFMRLLDVDPGFDPSHTLTMRVSLPRARYGGDGQQAQFFDRFFRDIDALPGVKAAGAVSWLPMTGLGSATSMEIIGQPKPAAGQEPVTDVRVMTHHYLEAMGVPLLKGRLFNEADAADATGRIVINETMAKKHWPGEDPLGKRVRINWGTPSREDEVIGVVGDVKHYGLDTPAAGVRPMIYWPYARNPYGTMTVAIRTAGDPSSLVTSVAGVLRRLDPELALAGVRTMDEVVSSSMAERRLTMLLLTIFAGAALVLAAVGIYGVIAYSVTQRTQEIGIRMALGAQRGDVLRLVVRQALVMVAAGIAAGAAGAFLLTRLMEGLLFDVTPTDPATFGLVSAALAGVAVLASGLPGLRATRVDPVIALRAE